MGGLVLFPEPGAGGGRDDVAQGRDTLGKGLLRRVVVGVIGDFRVCRVVEWEVSLEHGYDGIGDSVLGNERRLVRLSWGARLRVRPVMVMLSIF